MTLLSAPHDAAAPGVWDPHRDEPRALRWARRAVTIPAFFGFALLLVVTLPATLPMLALHDAVRRNRWSGVRSILALTHYFTAEALGLLASAAVGIAGALAPAHAAAWNFRLQFLWASWLFAGVRWLFDLHLHVRGLDAARSGPLLLLVRHASVVDTLLPAVAISSRTGLRLRYVMKRELLWDPCLDVVGQRVPNAFVRRGQGGSAIEIERVRMLARGLGREDGVMLFPEGTRFTPAKRARAVARVAEIAGPEIAARAQRLRHLLPPRLGGVLALLEAAPDTDVVFCAHTGLESLRTLNDLWSGALVGSRIEVELWRVPAASIPAGRDARSAWVYDEWSRVDDWLAARAGSEEAPA